MIDLLRCVHTSQLMISDLQNGPLSNRKYPVRPPAPVAPGAAVAPTTATPRGSGEERTEKEAPLTPATATTLPYGCSENIAHGQAAAAVAVGRSACCYLGISSPPPPLGRPRPIAQRRRSRHGVHDGAPCVTRRALAAQFNSFPNGWPSVCPSVLSLSPLAPAAVTTIVD